MPMKKRDKLAVALFFAFFLCVAIAVFRDYGFGWDEHMSRDNGIAALDYALKGDPALLTSKDRYYGPVFEMLLVGVERILGLGEHIRPLTFMRHLVTFLFFLTGVFFFYLLCKYRFGSWKIGLLGSLFLLLSPRIFANAFYNSKDTAFLSMFIISIYTLVKFLDKKTFLRTTLHALACALLIDIRILGIIVAFFTLFFLFIEEAIRRKEGRQSRKITIDLAYMLLLIFFTILFWPTLWDDPFFHFVKSFILMAHHRWPRTVLYMGEYIKATALPWHYVPVWLGITTPLFYTACFFIGVFVSIKGLFRKSPHSYNDKRNDLIFLLWFFAPVASVIVLGSVLYDGWRQMYFIYPAFLILALAGLVSVFKYVKKSFSPKNSRVIQAGLVLITAFSLGDTAYFMARWHPHQNIYFNILAGRDGQAVKDNFELDYWGLSYRKALEYILRTDPREQIKLSVPHADGMYNADILLPEQKKRLLYVKNAEDADYFLSSYRWHKEEYPYENEYYSLYVNGIKIMVAYKIR